MKQWKLDDYITEQLQDDEFAMIWRDGEGEYQAQRALIKARVEAGLSQRELSRVSGVPQKTISLIETSGTNTTVETLGKLARGMGKVLRISFIDPVDDEGAIVLEG